MKLIGIYKTNEAATKAKGLLSKAGIPETRSSLLGPDDTAGRHLATKAQRATAEYAARYAMIGAAIGFVVFGALCTGNIEYVRSGSQIASSWFVPALAGGFLGTLFGGIIGALIGSREPRLIAKFVEEDAREGGSALGVIVESSDEAEAVRRAFRSTGALHVESA